MKMNFELRGTQDMVKNIAFTAPFKHGLLKCLIYSMLKGGHKYTKIGLAMGVKIGMMLQKVAITLIC